MVKAKIGFLAVLSVLLLPLSGAYSQDSGVDLWSGTGTGLGSDGSSSTLRNNPDDIKDPFGDDGKFTIDDGVSTDSGNDLWDGKVSLEDKKGDSAGAQSTSSDEKNTDAGRLTKGATSAPFGGSESTIGAAAVDRAKQLAQEGKAKVAEAVNAAKPVMAATQGGSCVVPNVGVNPVQGMTNALSAWGETMKALPQCLQYSISGVCGQLISIPYPPYVQFITVPRVRHYQPESVSNIYRNPGGGSFVGSDIVGSLMSMLSNLVGSLGQMVVQEVEFTVQTAMQRLVAKGLSSFNGGGGGYGGNNSVGDFLKARGEQSLFRLKNQAINTGIREAEYAVMKLWGNNLHPKKERQGMHYHQSQGQGMSSSNLGNMITNIPGVQQIGQLAGQAGQLLQKINPLNYLDGVASQIASNMPMPRMVTEIGKMYAKMYAKPGQNREDPFPYMVKSGQTFASDSPQGTLLSRFSPTRMMMYAKEMLTHILLPEACQIASNNVAGFLGGNSGLKAFGSRVNNFRTGGVDLLSNLAGHPQQMLQSLIGNVAGQAVGDICLGVGLGLTMPSNKFGMMGQNQMALPGTFRALDANNRIHGSDTTSRYHTAYPNSGGSAGLSAAGSVTGEKRVDLVQNLSDTFKGAGPQPLPGEMPCIPLEGNPAINPADQGARPSQDAMGMVHWVMVDACSQLFKMDPPAFPLSGGMEITGKVGFDINGKMTASGGVSMGGGGAGFGGNIGAGGSIGIGQGGVGISGGAGVSGGAGGLSGGVGISGGIGAGGV